MTHPFKKHFEDSFRDFLSVISTDSGEWTVKGFIDLYKNIYTISLDTKVVSKVIELMIFPKIVEFARDNNYKIVLSEYQNHYPDVTFIDNDTGEKIALDIKSTYRINDNKVNGMTLGAFTGYFRNRTSTKNITFPYDEYAKHYVFGIIYSRTDMVNAQDVLSDMGFALDTSQRKKLSKYLSNQNKATFEELTDALRVTDEKLIAEIGTRLSECLIDERKIYSLDELQNILSVVRDFEFFLQEKWRIASDKPGSGNTKNIGSTKLLSELINGTGIFTKYEKGEEIFNDYWRYYLTEDMRAMAELDRAPYSNIKEYLRYKGIQQ